jgi:hypothetical protein
MGLGSGPQVEDCRVAVDVPPAQHAVRGDVDIHDEKVFSCGIGLGDHARVVVEQPVHVDFVAVALCLVRVGTCQQLEYY